MGSSSNASNECIERMHRTNASNFPSLVLQKGKSIELSV
ncbi:hypothetical protein PAMC26577_27460 [Caballeronia sordidicola]|uniref:Uncharacterized protein n=1 Tax=Caballeronia sordidicola TaxID=196367 RepID=A0A242MGE8_CABSO|nr:hypothetical protein PAMC26577_27460 [Caballeronia sordidicola]